MLRDLGVFVAASPCARRPDRVSPRPARGAALLALVGWLAAGGSAATPKFYPDDPIQEDNDRLFDAGGVQEIEASDYFDFAEHTFFKPGEARDIPAVNTNTLDEVPNSSWFTNRIGHRAMSIEEIVRGPDRVDRLSVDGWPIVQGKSEGLQPGYRVADPSGHWYQIEFDPPGNPEMATGAEMIGTAFYHAFGYNVVDVYLVEVDPETIEIAPTATIRDMRGRRRPFTRGDLEAVLAQSATLPNGRIRALASRFADGRPLGGFKYYGTRPDDPNDIFPHEHRRELRGNRVFAAWLNHDDSRSLNSLDMLVGEEGQQWVKHYMFDFGSILGSGTVFPQVPRAGNEYMLDWREGFLTLGTLGLYVRPWLSVDYPPVPPSVGRLEADFFDPEDWKPEYPNPAFQNMRPADAFWAARIVAKFSDEAIRAIVEKAQYSDPAATDYLTRTLIARRDKVLRTWLTAVNPIVDPALDASGALSFTNAVVEAGVAGVPERYVLTWSRFDNPTGAHEMVGEAVSATTAAGRLPGELAGTPPGGYVSVAIETVHPRFPHWTTPVQVYFRRTAGGWQTVGIERVVP